MNARTLLDSLCERDDIDKLPMTRAEKAYARLSGGVAALKKKVKLYTKVNAHLTNPGQPNKFVTGQRPDMHVTSATKKTKAPPFKLRK